MTLLWTNDGLDDYSYWLDQDRKVIGTINGLHQESGCLGPLHG